MRASACAWGHVCTPDPGFPWRSTCEARGCCSGSFELSRGLLSAVPRAASGRGGEKICPTSGKLGCSVLEARGSTIDTRCVRGGGMTITTSTTTTTTSTNDDDDDYDVDDDDDDDDDNVDDGRRRRAVGQRQTMISSLLLRLSCSSRSCSGAFLAQFEWLCWVDFRGAPACAGPAGTRPRWLRSACPAAPWPLPGQDRALRDPQT